MVARSPMPHVKMIRSWIGRKRFKYGAVEPSSKITGAPVRSSRSRVYVPVTAS